MASRTPKTDKEIYEVTVGGLYTKVSQFGRNVEEPYQVTFKSPSAEKALSLFKGKLSQQLMPLKYPGFKRLKTHELRKITNLTNPGKVPPDVKFMDENQIQDLIKEHHIPLKHELYPTLSDLRTAVSLFMESEEAFTKYQATREKLYSETLALQYDVMQLNKDLIAEALETEETTTKPAEPTPIQKTPTESTEPPEPTLTKPAEEF